MDSPTISGSKSYPIFLLPIQLKPAAPSPLPLTGSPVAYSWIAGQALEKLLDALSLPPAHGCVALVSCLSVNPVLTGFCFGPPQPFQSGGAQPLWCHPHCGELSHWLTRPTHQGSLGQLWEVGRGQGFCASWCPAPTASPPAPGAHPEASCLPLHPLERLRAYRVPVVMQQEQVRLGTMRSWVQSLASCSVGKRSGLSVSCVVCRRSPSVPVAVV